MKKNRMMRLASILLVCVLLTTSVISGTFAKYTTTGSASDGARVAAWGFGDATTITFDLFDFSYDTGKVLSEDGVTNVIAPGTSKTDTVKLNYADTTQYGAPEVAYTVDLNVTSYGVTKDIENNPNIKWYFNGTEYTTFGAMKTDIDSYHEDVAANNLPTIATSGISIGWAWAFETKDASGNVDAGQDAFDTMMGDKATDKVSLVIEYVAAQVD